MRARLLRRPSPAFLVACLALFVALGGPAQAAKLINGKTIRSGTVSSKQLKDKGIASRDLGSSALKAARYTPNNSVTASKIKRDAVGSSEVKANAIGTSEIAPSAVTSLQVADNSLLAQDLATGSVNSDEIVDGAVKNAELGTSAVTKGKLGGNAVGSSEVADGTLTGKDIGSFSGTAAVAPATVLSAGTCQTVTTAAQPAISGNQDMRDDLIVAGRSADLPNYVTVAAQANKDLATQFDVAICNLAAADTATTPAIQPSTSFTLPFLAVNP